MSQITLIEKQIAKQTKELADLQAQLEVEIAKAPDKALAESLHEMTCRLNHTDGCGWFYEFKNKEADWEGYSHKEYLAKARKLITCCNKANITTATAIEIYKLVNA